MKRLVLFVEGQGEAEAVPALVRRILTELNAWDAVHLDDQPFRTGEIGRLVKNEFGNWRQKLLACLKRRNVGGVLLLLDGDIKRVANTSFCAANVARSLSAEAAKVGAGTTFSVASVFACQEYESWIIAGLASLAGKTLPDGSRILEVSPPDGNLEEQPRNAKGWLSSVVEGGYKPTRHQADLTKLVDLDLVRERQLRSFRRLEHAISELVEAFRNNKPVTTPPSN